MAPRLLFALALRLYPRRFRERFGSEMERFLEDDYRSVVTEGGAGPTRFVAWTLVRLAAHGLGARLPGRAPAPHRDSSRRPSGRTAADRAGDAARTLRHAFRALRRSPAFTSTAVVTLALGLGACTTIFAVTYPVLLAPLPYPDAERLVSVYETSAGPGGRTGWVSPLTFRDWRERSDRFETLAAWRLSIVTWTGAGEPRVVRGWAVSAGFFPLLGLEMELGRGFTEEEDAPGQGSVAVLSHALWTQDFGSDPEVLGRTLSLDGQTYTIVGVADPRVDFPGHGDFFTPLGLDYGAELRDFRYLGVLGRVRPGVSVGEADRELARIAEQLAAENPETNAGWGAEATVLKEDVVGSVRPVLLGMSGAVGLLLLIALGNVANLSLGRGAGRGTERAVRRALGASRGDLVRAHLAEGMILSIAGSVLGMGLAYVAIHALGGVAFGRLPRAEAIALGPGTVAFAVAAAVLVGLGLGLLSLIGPGSRSLSEEIRTGSGGVTSSARVHRAREAVLSTQVALALALLIGAASLTRSLAALGRVDVGFDPVGLVAFGFDLPSGSYGAPEAIRAFYREALANVRAVPGVEAAGAVTPMPMELGSTPSSWTLSDTDPSDPAVMAHMRTATPGYLKAMGIRVLRGRPFDGRDVEGSTPVAVVSDAFVRRYLQDRDPLGVRITAGVDQGDDPEWLTIVGVVDDVRFRSLRSATEPEIYLPVQQLPTGWGHLVVRTRLPQREAARAVTAAVHEVDPDLPLDGAVTGEGIIGRQLSTTWLSASLSSLFAATAGALALVGMLGVLSITLAQRLREIGVRLLLGAPPRSIRWFALARISRSVGLGLALGLALSLVASRLLESQVYEVSSVDPLTFLLATVAFAGVSLAACVVPAARAGATDPVTLLRSE